MKKILKIVLSILGVLFITGASWYAYRLKTQKTIAILLYDNFTMLEAVGAYQTFPGLYSKNYRMKFIAKEKGTVKSSHIQTLHADYSFADIEAADILYIPGGVQMDAILEDEATLNWIKKLNEKTEYTLSVGSGTLLLAKLDLLKGKKATSHWYQKEKLENFGANYVNENYVMDGKYLTGMGASASIDMVLQLINIIAGEEQSKAMQLFIAYDPSPPIDSGTFEKADSSVQFIAQNLLNKQQTETKPNKTIAMMLYEGFTMLDMTGPYQVFKELKSLGYEMKFVAKEKGIIPSDAKLTYDAAYTFDELPQAEILFIPGGSRTTLVMEDAKQINWVKKVDNNTQFTTSVCTGSLVLGKAGLLQDRNATSHWYTGKFLKDYGATYSNNRYTKDGKYITGAGVSSGIDLALLVVKEAVGEDYAKAIQLKIGYFPNPPYDAGSPEKSEKKTLDRLSKMFSGAVKRYAKAKDAKLN